MPSGPERSADDRDHAPVSGRPSACRAAAGALSTGSRRGARCPRGRARRSPPTAGRAVPAKATADAAGEASDQPVGGTGHGIDVDEHDRYAPRRRRPAPSARRRNRPWRRPPPVGAGRRSPAQPRTQPPIPPPPRGWTAANGDRAVGRCHGPAAASPAAPPPPGARRRGLGGRPPARRRRARVPRPGRGPRPGRERGGHRSLPPPPSA